MRNRASVKLDLELEKSTSEQATERCVSQNTRGVFAWGSSEVGSWSPGSKL